VLVFLAPIVSVFCYC